MYEVAREMQFGPAYYLGEKHGTYPRVMIFRTTKPREAGLPGSVPGVNVWLPQQQEVWRISLEAVVERQISPTEKLEKSDEILDFHVWTTGDGAVYGTFQRGDGEVAKARIDAYSKFSEALKVVADGFLTSGQKVKFAVGDKVEVLHQVVLHQPKGYQFTIQWVATNVNGDVLYFEKEPSQIGRNLIIGYLGEEIVKL